MKCAREKIVALCHSTVETKRVGRWELSGVRVV
eukprot:CAMPEP_0114265688 /NCGR_PEP_ID=MMETSP0058-20121206/24091_1 /TAXON_ID=36894 /ORGANISM="Pyramimonas parkeae, CCMP726" /LENGTH=32 /DNA_ID= /DNA_START= /DNA_END= /DNA_ORIENTATION=